MILSLDPCIFSISVSYLWWFQWPALPRHRRNNLMVVLEAPYFRPFSIRGSIQHERVHRTSHVTRALCHLCSSEFCWPGHPFMHVLDRNIIHILSQFTERSVDFWNLSLLAFLFRCPFGFRSIGAARPFLAVSPRNLGRTIRYDKLPNFCYPGYSIPLV